MTPSDTTPQGAEPREDGWIEWTGGENPAPGQMVEYRMRDEREHYRASNALDWRHGGLMASDIIAYRIVSPAPATVARPGGVPVSDPSAFDDVLACNAPAAPTNGGGERPAYDRLSSYPDYISDKTGLWLFREAVLACGDRHKIAPVNYNSLARLIDTIEMQRAQIAALQPHPSQKGGTEADELRRTLADVVEQIKGKRFGYWQGDDGFLSDKEVWERAQRLAALNTSEARG